MELEQILARVVDGARQISQADAAAVRLLDKEGKRLSLAATSGLPDALGQQQPIPVEDSALDKEALATCASVVVEGRADPRSASVPGDYCSAICAPLVHEGDSIGTLRVYATAPRCFDEEDRSLLALLADLGAEAVAATRALTTLEDLQESRSRFIRVATHELRSPIAVAQSLVRGVLQGYAGALTDGQSEIIGRVSRRLDFLEILVNDLLDLAAGKAPELAEEEGAVAINSSVGRAVLLIQPRAEEKDVDLAHRVCCEELVVWGTEEGMDRIFVNLVENAVKYTPSGGSVTVSSRRAGDEIEVEVTDTGIGIPEEAMPNLFEEFYRAPNAKKMEVVGTGLGLTIVKDLVDRYGGRIEVESEVGRGTTVTVAFPIHQLPD